MLIAASIFALTLLLGLFALEPLGIPISAVAAACALILLVIAGQGRIISIRRVIKHAPWQIVAISLGMGLGVAAVPEVLRDLPKALHNIFESPITVGAHPE